MNTHTSNSQESRFSQYADAFEKDGVVILRGVLNDQDMDLIGKVFDQSIKGPSKERAFPEDDKIFVSMGNSPEDPIIERLMRNSVVADIAQGLFRGGGVWYWGEQAWLKEGGDARRTPWHQDRSYVPYSRGSYAVFWIPLESLAAENVLEVVRGSHKDTLYNGTRYELDDDTAPLFDEKHMPRLPDIESEREKWDIYSADMERGDILVFNGGCLHGGAPTRASQRRRTLSLRFLSDDVLYEPRPDFQDGPLAEIQAARRDAMTPGFDKLSPGDPVVHSNAYKKVRPWPAR